MSPSGGPLRDVLLVGFGAVGAIYSLIAKRSGLARITSVARSNYDLVNREGVHFQSAKYGEINAWKPDRLCKSVAEAADRQYSYVLVTTKAIPELSKTSLILQPFFSPGYLERFPQPTYVLMQNGLNVEVDLYNALKAAGIDNPKIISTAVWIGTNLLAPNVVQHNEFDRVTLGVYRHMDHTTEANTPEESALLQDFGSILEAGGTTLTIVPEIQRMKFAKNIWNVAFASFATLTNNTLPAIFRPPPQDALHSYEPYVSPITADLIENYTIPAIKSTLQELITLGRALGFPDSATDVFESTRAIHVKPNSMHTPSMMLDAQRGKPFEVEVIIGEVVRMARFAGVDVPRVETLYALLLVAQNQILRKLRVR